MQKLSIFAAIVAGALAFGCGTMRPNPPPHPTSTTGHAENPGSDTTGNLAPTEVAVDAANGKPVPK